MVHDIRYVHLKREERDLLAEETIFVRSFNKAYEHLSDEMLGLKPGEDREQWLRFFFKRGLSIFDADKKKMYLIKACCGEKMVGFALFKEGKTESEVSIEFLCIDPEYSRRGIGETLVFSIGKILPEIKKLVLMTRKVNTNARNFYLKKCGFKETKYVDELIPLEYLEFYVGYEWEGNI